MKTMVMIFLVATLMLAGCSASNKQNPYLGQQQVFNQPQGGIGQQGGGQAPPPPGYGAGCGVSGPVNVEEVAAVHVAAA